MKGKFGVAALIFSGVAFAVPVSTPNQLSDTPIISGGGNTGNLSMNNCRAYQTDGAAINLSGGETLVFYGGGERTTKTGGYLATKSSYSGTAYVRLSKWCDSRCNTQGCFLNCYPQGYAIGLFARNSDNQQDFIAGAGSSYPGFGWIDSSNYCSEASGGGWYGEPAFCSGSYRNYFGFSGSILGDSYSRTYCWFYSTNPFYRCYSYGFYGGRSGGAASSISAWYNYYTKDYTLPTTSATITGGGITGQGRLYVCQ